MEELEKMGERCAAEAKRIQSEWTRLQPECPFAKNKADGLALCSLGEMRICFRELGAECGIYNEQVGVTV